MTLYETLKKDMVQAMKDGKKDKQTLLKTVVAEVSRGKYQDHSDKNVVLVVKRMITELRNDYKKYNIKKYKIDADFLSDSYFPKIAQQSLEDINEFLSTIDFSKLGNKMEAIKLVLGHFPSGSVEGAAARNAVVNYEC